MRTGTKFLSLLLSCLECRSLFLWVKEISLAHSLVQGSLYSILSPCQGNFSLPLPSQLPPHHVLCVPYILSMGAKESVNLWIWINLWIILNNCCLLNKLNPVLIIPASFPVFKIKHEKQKPGHRKAYQIQMIQQNEHILILIMKCYRRKITISEI